MIIQSVIGGGLIGIAVSMLLLFNGKVLGVSGILGELFNHKLSKNYWRLFFVIGLLISPLIYNIFKPISLTEMTSNNLVIVMAGLLVGFGSRLGSGCTSGHGICGAVIGIHHMARQHGPVPTGGAQTWTPDD